MYKCIKNVNTDQGQFKVGDEVGDVLGSKYSQFEKIEDTPKPKKAKKPEPKLELLVETPAVVEIELEDEAPDSLADKVLSVITSKKKSKKK